MGYLNLLDVLGNISNKDECLFYIKQLSGISNVDVSMINNFHTVARNGLRFFTNSLTELTKSNHKEYYMWVDTGVIEAGTRSPIYISFYKSSLGWNGGLVGTESKLMAILKKSPDDKTILPGYSVLGDNLDSNSVQALLKLKTSLKDNDSKSETDTSASKNNKNSQVSKSTVDIICDMDGTVVDEKPVVNIPSECRKEQAFDLVISSNAPIEVTKDDLISYSNPVFDDCNDHKKDKDLSIFDCITNTEIVMTVFDRLLDKGSWVNPAIQLGQYLKSYISRLIYLIADKKCCNCYVFNKSGSKFIFNIGLLDKFGNEILLEATYVSSRIVTLSVVDSNFMLFRSNDDYNFTLNGVDPVQFYNSKSELIFTGSVSDFDLTNWVRLEHIFKERRERFPSKVRNLPLDVLYTNLTKSVKSAVTISRADSRYILPVYSIEMNRIQYLIPFHINTSLDKTPDLAIVVGLFGTDYAIMTVLPLDMVYSNYRVLSPYSESWLSKGVFANLSK